MIAFLICLVLGAIGLAVFVVFAGGGLEAHLRKRAQRHPFRNLK